MLAEGDLHLRKWISHKKWTVALKNDQMIHDPETDPGLASDATNLADHDQKQKSSG